MPSLDWATPRHIMQTIGTEWGREAIQKDLWIKVAMAKVDAIVAAGGRVVIDDLRFPNEYEAILRRDDAVLTRIVRPDAPRYEAHQSEGLLENMFFDLSVVNDDTRQRLIIVFMLVLSQVIAPVPKD